MFKPRKQLFSRAVAASFAVGFAALIAVAAQQAGRAPTSAAPNKVISIAAARALPPGTAVTVEGSVTVSPGVLKASRSDGGFAIQDKSGGIFVRTNADLPLRGVNRRVRVRGQLADESGHLILVLGYPPDVKVLGRGLLVQAEPVSTGHINEATEGRLVRVTGTITKPIVNELPRGHRVFIDDGSGEVQVYVYAGTTFPVGHLQPGRRISVTGFSGQHEGGYEVVPRTRMDIRLNH